MSRKQAKKKRKIWYKIVAAAIESQRIFSVVDSKHGSKYIYQEIAHYLLEGCDETAKCKSFNYYCRKVKGGFDHAINYLEREGIPVFKHRPSKRILYVTVDDKLMARQDDYDRVAKHVKQTVTAAKTHVQIACPRLENRFNKTTQKLLVGETE